MCDLLFDLSLFMLLLVCNDAVDLVFSVLCKQRIFSDDFSYLRLE